MFKQVDTRLRLTTRDNECYFFCVLDIFEEVTKYKLSITDVEEIHSMCVNMEYIGLDGWMKLKAVRSVAQIASAITGKNCYMKLVEEKEKYNHVIARFTRIVSAKEKHHFVRVDFNTKKVVTYDPYSDNGSLAVKQGKITGYRYIFAEAIK